MKVVVSLSVIESFWIFLKYYFIVKFFYSNADDKLAYIYSEAYRKTNKKVNNLEIN